jgi:uracil phosphoribosyltransferase
MKKLHFLCFFGKYFKDKLKDFYIMSTPFQTLTAKELSNVKSFCDEQVQNGRLKIIGSIPDEMRQDYLNEFLPIPQRAISNMSISSGRFRELAESVCDEISTYITSKYGDNVHVVYPWRAALAFTFSFAKNPGVKHCHLGIFRDEETLETKEYLPLCDEDFANIGDKKIVIADPMLATGGSIVYVIKKLQAMGASEDQIIVASVLSAPEGIQKLLAAYPNIRIITGTLDDHLNELGFIVPGLGDFGDKWMENLKVANFEKIRDIFSDVQWDMLNKKLEDLG